MTHIPGAMMLKRNITGLDFCQHCRGTEKYRTGTVWIDDPTGHGYIAACPMCEQGKLIASSQDTSEPKNRIHYPRRKDTWNNGITYADHRQCKAQPCHRPTSGTYCSYHTDEKNRTTKLDYTEIVKQLKAMYNIPPSSPIKQKRWR